MASELKVLSTTRKKTLNFYNKYKNIDFEQINEQLIDVLENIINNISGEMSNSITKDLILLIKDQNYQLTTLKTDLDLMKNNIVLKLYDIKKEYVDDMKLLINKNDNDNIIKILDKVEKENNKLISEIIPKSNNQYYNQYENLMKTFITEIKKENGHLDIENKYNILIKNIESSLINYISKTEDRIQTNITEIKNNDIKNNESQQKINDDLIKYLDKYKNSCQKGTISENHIENLLNSLYKTAEVIRTTDESKSGDFIMNRTKVDGSELPSILFEIKNYNGNVPSQEVTKFVRDINDKKLCGIMISISSGICNKLNYEINITEENNICLYIHDMNYDPDKLKLGVDIIDNLYYKLKLNIKNPNEYKISIETLEQINKEYNTFIEKRTLAINNFKELSKKTLQYIEELELMNLNKLLSSNSLFNNTSTLKCPYCEFVGTNVKSLAAHQRRCKNNITIISNEEPDIQIEILNDNKQSELSDINNTENEIIENEKIIKKSRLKKIKN